MPTASGPVKYTPSSYFGAKWDMFRRLKPYWPTLGSYETYASVCGGMAGEMLLSPPAPVEIYNDTNGFLVNFFRACRDSREALAEALRDTPVSRREWESAVEHLRTFKASVAELPLWPLKLSAPECIELARLYIIFLRQSLSVAPGKHWQCTIRHSRKGMASNCGAWANMPDCIDQVGRRMLRVQLECLPGWELIRKYQHTRSFLYIDPPYFHTTCTTGVYEAALGSDMSEAEHKQLLEAAGTAMGTVIISNYGNPLYDKELYRHGFERHELVVPCRSSITTTGKVAKRTTRTEVLWCRYAKGMRPEGLPGSSGAGRKRTRSRRRSPSR